MSDLVGNPEGHAFCLLQEKVHTAVKSIADLKKTPNHNDLWQGINQKNIERIILTLSPIEEKLFKSI